MRQNRGIGIVIAALLAGIAGGWLGGEFSRPPVAEAAEAPMVLPQLNARGFTLMDEQGRPRATIGMLTDGLPALTLMDAKGNHRAGLRITPDGPALAFMDEKGNPRLLISYDGKTDAASLNLVTPAGAPMATITGQEEIGMIFLSARGKPIWMAPNR